MSALENVFGVGVQIDALGKPIERGFGNLADQAKALAATQLPKVKSILQEAHDRAKQIIADAEAKAAALAAPAAAPPTVNAVVLPNVGVAPPAAGAPVSTSPEPTGLKAILAHVEDEINDAMKNL